jgi:lipid-binding SYLF domain-containing protein
MRKLICVGLLVGFIFSAAQAFAEDKWDSLLVESAKVFEEMTKMPEEGIPSKLVRDSSAIAIFPSAVSGGFIFGAKYGQGVILAKDKKTNKWSAPAVFNLGGASFGLQIGGQATDIILLVMSERGLDGLLQSKLTLGADAAVSAGPVGRDAQASTDLQLKGGIFSYSRSRGAFIGVKLEGAVISYNSEANQALYDKAVSAQDLLISKSLESPKSAERLLQNLTKY